VTIYQWLHFFEEKEEIVTTKREGSKPNSTLTVCATLSDLVFANLLHQDKTSDLLPYTSPPTLPVYIL
jgi:hypothetical protein